MKGILFLALLICTCIVKAQAIRFKVVKWDSKFGNQEWLTIYKASDKGSMTGVIDTAFKNITIDYRIPNADGQDIYTVDQIWSNDLFKLVGVDCFLMRLTSHGKDNMQEQVEAIFYKKDALVYFVVSNPNLVQREFRYLITITN